MCYFNIVCWLLLVGMLSADHCQKRCVSRCAVEWKHNWVVFSYISLIFAFAAFAQYADAYVIASEIVTFYPSNTSLLNRSINHEKKNSKKKIPFWKNCFQENVGLKNKFSILSFIKFTTKCLKLCSLLHRSPTVVYLIIDIRETFFSFQTNFPLTHILNFNLNHSKQEMMNWSRKKLKTRNSKHHQFPMLLCYTCQLLLFDAMAHNI